MKVVSWNCNGGFRNKYNVLFEAYPDADLYIVQECENPDFYNSKPFKELFVKGFHVGMPDYFMKGIGVFSPKGLHLRRTKCMFSTSLMMMGYAPFVVNNNVKILAVWPHGKYVEEMIDFFNANEELITDDLLIIGDTNSATEFNSQHPKKKNHTVMVEWLAQHGLVDAYNHHTNEAEGEETVPTFYLQRKKEKPYHLDRAFVAPSKLMRFEVAEDHDYWLQYSDHIPVMIEIV